MFRSAAPDGLGGEEAVNHFGEFLGHLIRERHHAVFEFPTSMLPAIAAATLAACGWACGSSVGVITKVGQRISGRRLSIS